MVRLEGAVGVPFKSKLLAALKRDDPQDEYLEDAEGISHQGPEGYLSHLLGFCGCGCPEEALAYVRDALQAIHDVKAGGWQEIDWKAMRAQFKSEGEAYFVWYRLDDLQLTEHGGSVPGWLTEKGEDMLDALNEALSRLAAAGEG